ncbi:hypothetical protein F8O07_05710 [Pseudoclavibacter sp. CFCC 13796]|uniref:hypothetical protein n=1 Tax=Pseudoclavibacter sp. CFCC 13796 TaxID=2615179 RepID=UPI00130149E8|nr:hypothetical protein [Pseudoclavibacter sp. CFCC 13796]KAB1661410.1 hypothetical protein F8O07_05710 [Pseudoclavibacter sp. CFCC 13796]
MSDESASPATAGRSSTRATGAPTPASESPATAESSLQQQDEQRAAAASRLKERIYITFTALAVVLTLASHADVTPQQAVTTLIVTVIGSVLAMFLAEILAHFVTHQRMFTASEARHAASTSVGATTAIALPILMLLGAWGGIWTPEIALRSSTVLLILWLVGIGFAAVRRLKLPAWQKLLVLVAEAALGLLVVGLELMAHH